MIESIIRTRPSIIYTTTSPPFDKLWRRQLFPEYQLDFLASSYYPLYRENKDLLDEFSENFEMINHIKCPSESNESGDIISSIIEQYTDKNDEVFMLTQPKKFEQLLALNDEDKRNM